MTEASLPATLRVAVVDCETTGLTPNDELIECSVVLAEVDAKRGNSIAVHREYVGLRKPSVRIHPAARKIHKISEDMLEGRDLDHQTVRELIAQADFIVAHNAKFDRHFFSKLYPEAKQKPWKCSCYGMGWSSKKGYPSKKLSQILEKHGIQLENAHRADADTKALLQLLDRQVSWLKTKRTYWQQLIKSKPISEDYWEGRQEKDGYSLSEGPRDAQFESGGEDFSWGRVFQWVFIWLMIIYVLGHILG